MTITVDPTATLQDDLSVELGVHNGATKTVLRIRKNGTLKFKNKHNPSALTITSEDSPAPFLVPGVGGAQSQFVVPAGENMTVTVSGAYEVGDQFAYKAQIGSTTPEDPIVIVDRR
jgi:hypothetical protein